MSDINSSPTAIQTQRWEEYVTARQVLASIELDSTVSSSVKMNAGLRVAKTWEAFLRAATDTSTVNGCELGFVYSAIRALGLTGWLDHPQDTELGRFEAALARTFLRGLEDLLHPIVRESIR